MIDDQWVLRLEQIDIIERTTGHIVKILIRHSLTRYSDLGKISFDKAAKRNPQKSETSGNVGLEFENYFRAFLRCRGSSD